MKEFITDRPSLEAIRDRVGDICSNQPKTPISMIPNSRPSPQDLLDQTYPRIVPDETGAQYLQITPTESVQVNSDDDGGHDTQLAYPNSLLLQLARLKERKDQLTRMDLVDLLRISNQMR